MNDEDREPWLRKIAEEATCNLNKNTKSDKKQRGDPLVVISCSVLKKKYRDLLVKNIQCDKPIHFVFLNIPEQELYERLKQRAKVENHFMPSSLIESQLKDLEPPKFNEGLDDRVITIIEGDMAKQQIDEIGISVIKTLVENPTSGN